MSRLKTVAGDDQLPVNIDDLDGDFDPKEYDGRMNVACKIKEHEGKTFFFRCSGIIQ